MRKARPTNPYQYSMINAKVPFLAPDVVAKVIPSPIDGLDAISPLAEMDPKRAPILTNWVPRPGYVELRGGYAPWGSCGTLSTPVETLMTYRSATTEQMFAAAGGNIYNASASGGPFPSVVSGQSTDRWQYINFTNTGGTSIIQCVNGSDDMLQYDGSSWTTPTISGLPGGVTTASFINIYAQKARLWYIIEDSQTVAYMPVGANTGPISGTLNFGGLWSMGGYLVAMTDWTIDGGQGPQDYAAFISSRGQITLYAGTDPTNAAAWQLVGTFSIAPPIGYRCLTPVGSDVAIITIQGVLPISQVLPFDPSADRSTALTARIQNAVALAGQQYYANFGWQFISFPAQQLVLLNIPQVENVTQVQYAMNALTGAWCQFNGWKANCFTIFQENLYFGDNFGLVDQAYTGSSDFANSIQADMQCAFNWLDEPGRVKRMTMIQPLLNIGGEITPTLAVDTDFMNSTAVAPIETIISGVLWDVAVWDVSNWSAQQVNYINWLSVEAIGHALAVRMRVNITGPGNDEAGVFDIGEFDFAEFDSGLSSTLPLLQVNAFNSIAELGGAI